ncbi:amidohydrolase family protein [Phycisphaerales bacterium AB-hyl4]|uniref:Amidohydrolase family protein n=1 Tax=Natronomicrosphaera hydrolytica TaxID=3242702 RepID=A0ABV4U6R8_9BACT
MTTTTAPTAASADAADSGKQLSLIDCDVHNAFSSPDEIARYLPKYFRQRGLSLPGRAGFSSPLGVARADAVPDEGGKPGSSIAKMREQLIDAYNMDYVILTGGGILSCGVHAEADYGAAVARAYNEWFAEKWLDADPRMLGSLLVAPNNPAEAVKEIRRIGGHERLVQVIMTSATRTALGDRFYWPIYEAACEMGMPVAVHPGAESTGIANTFAPGFPASYFEWHSNLSQNYMGQVSSLISRGVFCEFPQLKFVCIEGGIGWAPHLMWRLDKNWKSLRATTPWLTRPPSEYLVEHIRFTTQPIEEPEKKDHLLQILDMVHAEKTVMFSSDYPHWDNDCPVHGLPKLPEPLKQRIMWQNAAELYNLKPR